MHYAERLRRVRQEMERRDLDLLFLPPSANLQYLTGIERDRPNYGNVNYPGGWVMGALIGREREPIILAPRMIADYHLPADVVRTVRALPDHGDPVALMRQTLAEFGTVRRAAIEDRAWAAALVQLQRLLPDARWSPASEIMAPLRMIKDEDEVAVMRRASLLADQVLAAVLPQLKRGITELDVALEVEAQMTRLGSNGPSFTTNVFTIGTHEHREMRETVSRRPLVEGASLSFDFGCVLEGYCSDFGRTVHIGDPSAEFRRAYETVIGAHDAAIRAMKAGAITAEQADATARHVVDEAGFGEHFRHRLGHGIGLDVHEGPFLTAGDGTLLQDGMAFTVEPSIYWIGRIGTRIEDVVIVRPDGGEVLNRASTALHVVA
jgi:Xaa-Pro aminopeptidase